MRFPEGLEGYYSKGPIWMGWDLGHEIKPYRSMTRAEVFKFYLQQWPETFAQEPLKDQALSDRKASFDKRWEREFGSATHTRRA